MDAFNITASGLECTQLVKGILRGKQVPQRSEKESKIVLLMWTNNQRSTQCYCRSTSWSDGSNTDSVPIHCQHTESFRR